MTERATETELTPRAVVFGLVVGIVLAAANVYVGLKIGYVDAGTNVVILLAFAGFGAARRRFRPAEAAIAAAAGSSAAMMALTTGLVGPVPALAMGGHEVSVVVVALWGIGLGVLGSLLAIPFRQSLLVVKKLAFPSARAAGLVIQSLFEQGGRARDTLRVLAAAAFVAAVVTLLRDELQWIPGGWMLPIAIAGVPAAVLSVGLATSPLLFGAGFLVGLRAALSMLAGALVAWVAIAPQLVTSGIAEANYPALVTWTLWPGAALMVASSLTTLLLGAGDLLRAVRGELRAKDAMRRSQLAIAALGVALVLLGWLGFGVNPLFAVIAIVLSALFAVAAMHATGETDTTPSGPLGGLTQIVVGAIGPGGISTPLHAGGVVNGVATHSAQMLNAWKTGEAAAAAPRRVMMAQLIGVVGGTAAAVVAFWVIREAYGLASESMPMPGPLSWKATADAVAQGTSSMPDGAPLAALAGAAGGVVLALVERSERLRGFVPSAVAMGMGFILPAALVVALTLGAIVAALVERRAPGWTERNGAALGSGLMVGEGFTGVVLAAIVVIRTLT